VGRVVKGGHVVKAERARILLSAEAVIDDARREAAALLEAARAERESIVEAAREEGRRQGEVAASALLVDASRRREQLLGGVQDDVVVLAMEVARKVIRRELEARPEDMVAICADVLRQVVLARSVTLIVHPDDEAMVRSHEGILAAGLDDSASLHIVVDDEVGRGGCVVESDMGRIDARLETQLAAIERALTVDDG